MTYNDRQKMAETHRVLVLHHPGYIIRLTSLFAAFMLALAGLLAAFFITASLFNMGFLNPDPGEFLVGAYGILAFMVPVYLFWAAWILADPAFKPGRIFVLSASLIPFFTLAAGFFLIRDSGRHQFAPLRAAGAFGFTVIILAILECFAITVLHARFFGKKSPPADAPPEHIKVEHDSLEELRPDEESHESGKKPGIFRPENLQGPAYLMPRETVFPEIKPLASSMAILDLEQRGCFPQINRETINQAKTEITINVQNSPGGETARFNAKESETAEIVIESKSVVDKAIVVSGPADAPGPIEETVIVPAKILQEEALPKEPCPLPQTSSPTTADETEMAETGREELEELEQEAAGQIEQEEECEEHKEIEQTITIPVSLLTPYSRLVEEEGTALLEEENATITDAAKNDAGQEVSFRENAGNAVLGKIPPDYAPAPEIPETKAAAFAVSAGGKSAVNKPAVPAPKPRKSWAGKHYHVPVKGILNQYPDGQYWIIDETTQQAARILQETLKEFKIEAEVTGIRKGPVITMFEILPAPGVKLSKIVNLQDNIALRLAASSVRIVAPIPGKHAVGIEVPNKRRNIVSFREIIEGELQRPGKRPEIPMVLGKDITGEAVTVDLAQTPHLLIAGSTGSGKSVCVNSMILSILYQRPPADCRLILIDPKIVELKLYNDIPHLLTPVITEPKRAFQALQYCICEMERRYACLDSMGVRDIKSYNRRIRERSIAAEHMPYIVVVIDEFADLMATTGKELESTVARLAAMSRAVGIHLVLATQRPSIDVITGLIKANIPSRIAFMVASKMDSRIIIDMVGAEKLLGKGDMLYAGAVDPFPIRMQGAFISEEEVECVVDYVKSLGEPEYIDDEIFYDEDEEDPSVSVFGEGDDPLYDKALEVVYQQGKASASYIQRRLKIGYNRAARLVEEMEHRGVVGPAQGSRPRELLRSA
jgi:S-DNA-T family DNA segregation ATPase FtsK/SpoIIIE